MSNPSKQKGTAFETLVVEYLKSRGIANADRPALHGSKDQGDITGIPGWTLEAKNRRALGVGPAIDEARIEAANAGTRWYAAIIKRPRKGYAGEAIAAMPFSLLVDLILEPQPLNIALIYDVTGHVIGTRTITYETEAEKQQREGGG